jgi:hypothetical protein
VHAERKVVAVDGEALEHIFRRFIIKGRHGRGALEVVRVERGPAWKTFSVSSTASAWF